MSSDRIVVIVAVVIAVCSLAVVAYAVVQAIAVTTARITNLWMNINVYWIVPATYVNVQI